jgi:hypothetical protein
MTRPGVFWILVAYGALLVLARALWAFSIWYELIPLVLALCIFLFARSNGTEK